jgi:beta-xylosidase
MLSDGSLDGVKFNAALQAWQQQVNDPSFQVKTFAEYMAWQEQRAQMSAQWIAEFEKSQPVDTEAIEQCLAALHATQGFAVDLSGAYAVKLPDADWSKLDENGARVGTAWLTAGYIVENLRRAGSTKSAMEGSVLVAFRAQRENAHEA